MPNLAANITMMFTEVPFMERFAAAAAAGFRAVEFQYAYEYEPARIAAELERHHLAQALFNAPPGDTKAGERGHGALPGRERDFIAGVERALAMARAIKCPRIHCLAGIPPKDVTRAAAEETYVANLRCAAELAKRDGVTLLIEPLNIHDNPGYFLNTTGEALRIIERVGHPNLGLQFDLYHAQIMEGDLTRLIRRIKGRFQHVQIAGVPERHEPDRGEVNFPYLFDVLDETGYAGWIGCEYRPRAGTLVGLGWARPWGIGTGA